MARFQKAMLFFGTVLLMSTAVFSQDTLKIYVLAGQSNMEGQGMVLPDLNTMARNGGLGTLDWYVRHDTNNTYSHIVDSTGKYIKLDNVWIDYKNGDLVASGFERRGNLTTGYGSDTTKIGPEFQFGHVMSAYHNEQVLLIKWAWGGQSLAIPFRPPHAVSTNGYRRFPTKDRDTGYAFMLTVKHVRTVLANLKTYFPGYNGNGYKIAGFGFHQGFNDALDPGPTAEYESNLTWFIKDMRDSLNTPNMPFAVAAGCGLPGWNTSGNQLKVVQAQAAVADPTKHPEFAGTVGYAETRDFYHDASISPAESGSHNNLNGDSYFQIGNALGVAMTKLLYNASPFPPKICRQPSSISVTPGAKAKFMVYAFGDTITYQWQKNSANISGANGPSYSTPATTTGDNGALYRCVLTNAKGSTTSTAATLTVNSARPSVTTEPANITVSENQPAVFSVSASGGSLSYQWQKNGVTIAGATLRILTIPSASGDDNGARIRCIVTNPVGADTSNAAIMTVQMFAPKLTTPQTSDFNVKAGGTATFLVNVIGSGLTYQWQKNNVNIPGSNRRIFTVTAGASDNGAVFRCVVSNSAGSVTGNGATLHIRATETGYITTEWWDKTGGDTISALVQKNPNYPNNPTGITQATELRLPDLGISFWFGARMHGYLIPPANGDYTFTMSVDDAGVLYLSTSADTAQATMIIHTSWNAWPPTQPSTVTLQQGKKYYIRTVMVQSGGGGGMDVQWQGPGITKAVIAGTYLSPYLYPVQPATVTKPNALPMKEQSAFKVEFAPFTNFMNIRFDLPKVEGADAARVKISLYNLSGRQIAVVADRVFKSGSHSIVYKARETVLPGVYFIRISSAGFTQQRKVVKVY